MNESQIEPHAPRPRRRPRLLPLYASALTAALFVLPMFIGSPSGHDLQPHLASWMEVRSQWGQGIWFPRWAEWSNNGFGEPRFIFYPPTSGLIGAALGLILPWKIVPGALVWLSLLLAGLGMYKLARDWLDHQQSVIAAILFAANPYNVILIYYRGAFAELLAAALFPLMIWAGIRTARDGWKHVPMLSVMFAAIWITNTPAAVIATYTLIAVFVVCCAYRRSVRPLVPATVGLAMGFGLAAFYVGPAWWEQRWINVAAIIANGGNPERNFLFAINNSRAFLGFTWIVSAVAVCLMLLTTVAIVLNARLRRARSDIYWVMIMLAVISWLLMLPVSSVLWRYVPKLAYLQFPWRWLIVLAAAFAVLVASATQFRTRFFWFVALCICAAPLALSVKVEWRGNDVSIVQQKFSSGSGYFATTNFTPIGADRGWLEEHAPLLQRVDKNGALAGLDDAYAQISEWSAERKIFSATTKEEVTLAIKLLNYPAWQVFVDGQPGRVRSFESTGQILITLPPGDHRVELVFRRTRDRTLGGVISGISLGMLIAAAATIWWPWRKGRRKTAADSASSVQASTTP